MASTISHTPPARRVHYQSQTSNASLSQSQNLSNAETSNVNELLSSFAPSNSLVTVIYSNASYLKALKPADNKTKIISGVCTFVRLVYGENQQLLLNSYASCQRLLNHIKPIIGVQTDEIIDLMDNEGKLKELNTHGDDYASQYLTGRSTYFVLKIEHDIAAGEKRYIPSFNLDQIDQKLSTVLTNAFNSLNKSVNKTKRPTPGSKQNTPTQPTSTTTQSKQKRTTNKK